MNKSGLDKLAKTTGASKVLEKGENVLRNGVERVGEKIVEGGVKLTGKAKDKIRSLVEHKDIKCRDLLKMRGGHGSATKQGDVGEWWDKTIGEVANAAVQGDEGAETVIKLIKKAESKAQKYGGK